jgi:hypothetical protein
MWDAMDGMSLAVWPVPTHPTELETEIVPEVAPEAVSEPNDGVCC